MYIGSMKKILLSVTSVGCMGDLCNLPVVKD